MLIFSKEKFIEIYGEREGAIDWVSQCDGVEVFKDEYGDLRMVGVNRTYFCETEWCIEVEIGCVYCRNEKPFEEIPYEDGDYTFDGESEYWEEFISHRDRYISEMDFNYCPYCGRKLVENES